MSGSLRIAVLMGGDTAEREISIVTGRAVANGLREAGHTVEEIELGDLLQVLPRLRANDVVFPALHGGAGEDGRVQGVLEIARIPYVGSRPGPSALAMNKLWTKQIARGVQVPTTPEFLVEIATTEEEIFDAAGELGGFTVLKPIDEGSAVGVHLCPDRSALRGALSQVGERQGRWMLEPFVPGRELTVGIVLDQACPVIEIRPREGFYDYRNKYTAGCTEYFCPADLSEELAARVREDALRLHRALELRDMARIDFRLDPERGHFLLEANTIPGMTATSLLPKGAAAMGIGFVDLCDRLCRAAHRRGASTR